MYLTQTLKPGIDLDSLWIKVLSDIRFQNREGLIQFEDLLWQVIFLHNRLM